MALTAWQVAGARSAIAAVVLLLAIPEARGKWTWRMVPVAAAYAATLISFVLANRLTTSANAIFLQSAAPLYVLLMGPLLLHEPVRRSAPALHGGGGRRHGTLLPLQRAGGGDRARSGPWQCDCGLQRNRLCLMLVGCAG